MTDDITPAELVRWLERVERKAERNGETYASKTTVEAHRELAAVERQQMREDIDAIKEGLRWAVRLAVTMVFTNLGALVLFFATKHTG